MGPLLTLLAKQTALKTLKFEYNRLSDTQKEEIGKVVTKNAPECKMQGEIKVAKVVKKREVRVPKRISTNNNKAGCHPCIIF